MIRLGFEGLEQNGVWLAPDAALVLLETGQEMVKRAVGLNSLGREPRGPLCPPYRRPARGRPPASGDRHGWAPESRRRGRGSRARAGPAPKATRRPEARQRLRPVPSASRSSRGRSHRAPDSVNESGSGARRPLVASANRQTANTSSAARVVSRTAATLALWSRPVTCASWKKASSRKLRIPANDRGRYPGPPFRHAGAAPLRAGSSARDAKVGEAGS